MLTRCTWHSVLAGLAFLLATSASAETNLVFVLDGSGSMWGQLDGTAKIETAKRTLTTLLADLPPGTRVGLVSYGNNRKDDCDDVSVLARPGTSSTEAIQRQIADLSPKGMTPIARSLEMAGTVFASTEPGNNHVVLISDGLETCDGDPCAAAAALAAKGIELKVHVVGFDVSEEEGAQLRCISEQGGGQYFNASNIEGFEAAMAEVVQIAEAPVEKLPAKSELQEFFRDDFDGEDISSPWQVQNPDPDAFLVEDGSLLLIAGSTASLAAENITNLSLLDLELPASDWVMTASMTIDFQSGADTFSMGVYADKDNFLEARLEGIAGYHSILHVKGVKRSKGVEKTFTKPIHDALTADYPEGMSQLVQPIELRVSKKGRSYVVSVRLPQHEDPSWKELPKFTILRLQGKPFIAFYQRHAVAGESLVHIDWIKIEAPAPDA